MIILLLSCLMIFCGESAANAQEYPPKEINFNDPQSTAQLLMQQYDFNRDGKISEKEFIIGDGKSDYRAHLSNMHKGLDIEKRDNITKQQYWFVEIGDPAKYQTDLKKYFAYMDKDGDGYISCEEYQNTFQGKYISEIGEKYAELIDANHDHRISFDEFINFDFTSTPINHESFRSFDTNGDSFITSDEFKKIFSYFKERW